MTTKGLGMMLGVGLLVAACGDSLTAPGGQNQRVIGNYLIEFQMDPVGLQAGTSAAVGFSVRQALTRYDVEAEEMVTLWAPVDDLNAVVYCLLPNNGEHFHPAAGLGDGRYEAMHTFDPGATYAALRFVGADGEPVNVGFWVNVPLE